MSRRRTISVILAIVFPGLGLLYLTKLRGLLFVTVGIIVGGIVLLDSIPYLNLASGKALETSETTPFLVWVSTFIGMYLFSIYQTARIEKKLPPPVNESSLILICPNCGGSGEEPRTQPPVEYAYYFLPNFRRACGTCYGKGKVPDDPVTDENDGFGSN